MPRLWPLRRFRVEDTSMQPTLHPGDRVLVMTWLAPRRGDVVVLRDPDAHLSFTGKRVDSVTPDGEVVVRGDNPNVSRDSRHFGPLPRELIVGRAVYRYYPADRSGSL
jgi:nickel-type superoxide dismutase maturation protease